MNSVVIRFVVSMFVIAVSGAEAAACPTDIPETNPDTIYLDHGDGTVTDIRTGLMWKKCTEGLSGGGCQSGSAQGFSWSNALSHAEASDFAGYNDWRLPNVKELSTLIEHCRFMPSINTSRFPNTPIDSFPRDAFWSSSPVALDFDRAWFVSFWLGDISGSSRSHSRLIRLVRAGK